MPRYPQTPMINHLMQVEVKNRIRNTAENPNNIIEINFRGRRIHQYPKKHEPDQHNLTVALTYEDTVRLIYQLMNFRPFEKSLIEYDSKNFEVKYEVRD